MTMHGTTFPLAAAALLTLTLCAGQAPAQVPEAIAAPGETTFATLHAEGAQVYECKTGTDGKLTWAFREPIATLLVDGKTVGRHYAGPNWDHADGSGVTAKVAANAPAKSANDIPWLKLQVSDARGNGMLTRAKTVQRINTQGGVFSGSCDKAGAFHAAPYSADYVFLGKEN
jgi:Protein of unknown function (DUF3455)